MKANKIKIEYMQELLENIEKIKWLQSCSVCRNTLKELRAIVYDEFCKVYEYKKVKRR